MKKTLNTIALLLAVAIIGTVGVFNYIADDMCGNEIHKEYLSPNGSLKAVVFQRDCGATTGYSSQISILDANEKLGNEAGNIFIIKDDPKSVAPILEWKSDTQLHIQYELNGREFKAQNSFGWFDAVEIVYNNELKL